VTNKDEQFEDRLGHRFQKPELLGRALTHSSALPELRAADVESVELAEDNEQLEFLGDAVLDLLASEYLLEKFPKWSEGQLSKSCLLYTSPSPRDLSTSRMPSSA